MDAAILELLEELAHWQTPSTPAPPPPPVESTRVRYKLGWVEPPTEAPADKSALTITEARHELQTAMSDYATSGRSRRDLLLVKAQPGVGKTYAAIQLAQQIAQNGRVLYMMPTHDHYHTLAAFPHFQNDNWYHWRGYNAPRPDNESEPMCRFAPEAAVWMAKGYSLMSMCESLCPIYRQECPYRCQGKQTEPVIAGVHEHSVTGLAIDEFGLAVIDEMPLRAFLSPKNIPLSDICPQSNSALPSHELQIKLLSLAATSGRGNTRGKALLDAIGDLLGDVYAQVEDARMLPAIPFLSRPEDVHKADSWYLPTLLKLLVSEWSLWKQGASSWMERVVLTTAGMTLYDRGKAWKKLPRRLIALDATANLTVYKQMFSGREIIEHTPHVQRQGSIYQVVSNYNGKGQMLEGGEPTESAGKLLSVCQTICKRNGYTKPGVITFKNVAPLFAQWIGEDRVAHFFGQRGSNDLADADALFVIGTPSPNDLTIMQSVTMLVDGRSEPFAAKQTDNGAVIPIRSVALRTYPYQIGGVVAARYVSGFWHDDDLQAMSDQYREMELLQSIHRARPLTRKVDVYLFSSVPIGEDLNGIYDHPGPLIGCPDSIYWENWLKIAPYLETADNVTNEALAAVAGVSVGTVGNGGWLDAIREQNPNEWEICLIRKGRGRPSVTLKRDDIPY